MNKEIEQLMKVSVVKGILLSNKSLIEYAEKLKYERKLDKVVVVLECIEVLRRLSNQQE